MTTPLAPLDPKMAVADASFKTSIDSMSFGFRYSIPPVVNGIPSTTKRGEFDAVKERTPRILILPTWPGRSLE